MPPHLVLLNGPAGVGKTTVGRLLAARVPNGACIHGDDLRPFVVQRVEGEVQTGMAYVNGATIARNFLAAGFGRVVFEFVFEHPRHVRRTLDAFNAAAPVRAYTLWAPLAVVTAREAARPDRERLGDRVRTCWEAIRDNLAELGEVVDATDREPEAVANEIDHRLRHGLGPVPAD